MQKLSKQAARRIKSISLLTSKILVISLLGFIIVDVFTGLIGFFVTLNENTVSKPIRTV